MASSWEENFCDAGRCGRRRGASVCWRLRADPAEHGEVVGAEKRGGGSVTLPRTASPTGSSTGGGGVASGESDVPSPPKSEMGSCQIRQAHEYQYSWGRRVENAGLFGRLGVEKELGAADPAMGGWSLT
ncbi:hypothetical protein Bbelb_132860 [Branchiostoma belcheri]|nr:hypothetical protein Bbelb_132860 [Branchiostoma belcheri]